MAQKKAVANKNTVVEKKVAAKTKPIAEKKPVAEKKLVAEKKVAPEKTAALDRDFMDLLRGANSLAEPGQETPTIDPSAVSVSRVAARWRNTTRSSHTTLTVGGSAPRSLSMLSGRQRLHGDHVYSRASSGL